MLVPDSEKADRRGWPPRLTGSQRFNLMHRAMKRVLTERLEWLADGLASASLGGAVGLFTYRLLAPMAVQPALVAYAAAAAVIAYGASRSLLGLVGRRLPATGLANVSLQDALWVDNCRAAAEPEPESETRPLAELDPRPDSSVVLRLVDPANAAPSNQPDAPADRHASHFPGAASHDASDALHEALNQLRQSLVNRR